MLQGKRILIVDDDEFSCDVLSAMLQRNEARVRALRDCRDVEEFLKRERYDGILIDNFMPIKGVELFEELIRPKGIPTVMMSGFADPVDIVRFIRAGGRDFLQKPIGYHALASSMFAAISGIPCEYVPVPSTKNILGIPVESTDDLYHICRLIGASSRERLMMVYFNDMHEVIGAETIAVGDKYSVWFTCRDVFRRALKKDAAAIAVAHNHPSGKLMASREDIAMTHTLKKAGEFLGIPLLQHLIVTTTDFLEMI